MCFETYTPVISPERARCGLPSHARLSFWSSAGRGTVRADDDDVDDDGTCDDATRRSVAPRRNQIILSSVK